MSLADSMLLLVFSSKDDKATHARFVCVCVCLGLGHTEACYLFSGTQQKKQQQKTCVFLSSKVQQMLTLF